MCLRSSLANLFHAQRRLIYSVAVLLYFLTKTVEYIARLALHFHCSCCWKTWDFIMYL